MLIQNAALEVLLIRCRDHFSSASFDKFKKPATSFPILYQNLIPATFLYTG